MFAEDHQDEDLKAFEAELASLRPRADGLDPRWRFLLAQEAALNHNRQDCDAPTGYPSVCVRCGAPVSTVHKEKRRWAWPAAFSAMTTVAAALLVALIGRPEPQIAMQIDKRPVLPASTPFAEKQDDSNPWAAMGNLSRRGYLFGTDEMAYLNLRNQVLCFGVESWRPPASEVATATKIAEPVLSSREQLDLLLKQEGLHGS